MWRSQRRRKWQPPPSPPVTFALGLTSQGILILAIGGSNEAASSCVITRMGWKTPKCPAVCKLDASGTVPESRDWWTWSTYYLVDGSSETKRFVIWVGAGIVPQTVKGSATTGRCASISVGTCQHLMRQPTLVVMKFPFRLPLVSPFPSDGMFKQLEIF